MCPWLSAAVEGVGAGLERAVSASRVTVAWQLVRAVNQARHSSSESARKRVVPVSQERRDISASRWDIELGGWKFLIGQFSKMMPNLTVIEPSKSL